MKKRNGVFVLITGFAAAFGCAAKPQEKIEITTAPLKVEPQPTLAEPPAPKPVSATVPEATPLPVVEVQEAFKRKAGPEFTITVNYPKANPPGPRTIQIDADKLAMDVVDGKKRLVYTVGFLKQFHPQDADMKKLTPQQMQLVNNTSQDTSTDPVLIKLLAEHLETSHGIPLSEPKNAARQCKLYYADELSP